MQAENPFEPSQVELKREIKSENLAKALLSLLVHAVWTVFFLLLLLLVLMFVSAGGLVLFL